MSFDLLRRPALTICTLLLAFGLWLPFASEACAKKAFRQTGVASWYGAWHHGKITANGEDFDMFAMTAAHRKLPLGTIVKVTRKSTGKSIIVRINDRGPYKKRRIIDLSYAAAGSLGLHKKGVARVTVEAVSDRKGRLLSERHAFYVRLADEKASSDGVRRQLGRLIRLGIHDAAVLLHERGGVMSLGPYDSFGAAQAALTRVATTHADARIQLEEKSKMRPAVSGMAAKAR